jgi:hypothetical protein
MINKLIVVVGPQACGKTKNRDALAYFFNADVVLDCDQYSMAVTSGNKKHMRQLHQMIEHNHQGAKVVLALVNAVHPLTEQFFPAWFEGARLEVREFYSVIEEAKRVYGNRLDAFSYAIGEGAPMPIGMGESSESVSKPHQTTLRLPEKDGFGGCVMLTDLYQKDTSLILQRGLVTKIETYIDRDEACVLVEALVDHFTLPAPTTIPHGHGPVGAFYAQLDEARARDCSHISLSRGHANLIAEHIRLLEEQLAALQAQVGDPERVRRLNEQAAIENLLGHVEDGSNDVVTIFQDDATETWTVRVGQTRSEFGDTLSEALRKHFTGNDLDSQQVNKSLSTGSRPVDKWDGVPDECVATGQSCEYAPDGMNGEMQCKYCGKSIEHKNADV